MPLSVRRFPKAKADQSDIWLAIAEHSLGAADSVADRIDEVVRMLANQPEAGRARDDLRQGVRYFPVDSYLIFYSVSGGDLEVRRIIHGARKILPELFEQ
jgi:toxin ParE1/3/4